ncbi:MAG: hypothetical protein ACE5IL_10055, partial [Myxococcota bacterium]
CAESPDLKIGELIRLTAAGTLDDGTIAGYQAPFPDERFLTAFSDGDPVTRGGEKVLQERIPGARNQSHVTIRGAGHFLQEDRPEEVAQTVLRFIEKT